MGLNNHRTLVFFVFCVTILFFGANAMAQGNLKLGKMTVGGSAKYELDYDDNIFLDPTDEVDDVYHVLNPIISLGYTGSRPGNYVRGGYSGNWVFYQDNSDNNWTNQSPYISMGYESPMGFYATLDESFNYAEDPYGSQNRFAVGTQTTRLNNTIKPLLGYHFSDKWSAEGYYRNYFQEYDDDVDKWQNTTENGFSGAVFRRITAKTSLLAEFRYNEIEYPKQNNGIFDIDRNVNWSSGTSQDNTQYDIFVGARFEPGGKILGFLKLGYGEQDWKNNTDPLGNKYEDDGTFIADIGLTYFMNPRTTLTLNWKRNFMGSPDPDASSYISMPLMLIWSQEYAHNFSSNLTFRWQYDDYLNEAPGLPSKSTNLYNIKARVSYTIKKWVQAAVEYEYEDISASNDRYSAQEYTVNRGKFILLFTY
jgi:putative beta-barrel porin BBP2